ncbi:MAG: MaoC/PaaZ C-terminal domain-containing protein [Deltaproteobacteria bacterium]|nr:MaoC/PaaZ C-terminal domain-containing protein [Deltaproteobacteria bacterium]
MAKNIKDITVGESFSASEEVDKYRAIYYAGASGDFNPIHIDPEIGKMVGLGGVILHGLCTFGFMTKTVTDWAGDPGTLKRIKCRFARPVHLGDTITTSGTVSKVQGNRVSIDLKVMSQEGVEVLAMATAEVEL